MLRIWSEHLPYAEARSADVLDLLEHHDVHPIFAVPPDADLDALAGLLSDVTARGLEPGLWPLLADADGYWPSERNAPAYFTGLHALLDTMEAQGIKVPWLAVDLEPPLQQIDMLRHAAEPVYTILGRLLRENLDPPRFQDSILAFRQGLEAIHARGAQTIAVALPMVAHDLRDGIPLWQDMFEAPWAPVGWDRAGVMAYGSMVSGYSRGWLSEADARAIHYRLFLRIASAFGPRAHASIGITGIGKLGDEPVYADAEALALDASAARAAGIEDLAIFCLEGLVGRADAGAWLGAVANAPPIVPPMTAKARLTRVAGATVRRALKALLARAYRDGYDVEVQTHGR